MNNQSDRPRDRVSPTRLRLEASSLCQLRCPSCPTATGAIVPTIGTGFLRFRDFKALLEQHNRPRVSEVELSNYGEIFLNPELLDIITYAHEERVILSATNGVNLNTAKEAVLEGLVKYKFLRMTCSIDGASDETYRAYRNRGSFDAVISNIRVINEYKRRYRSLFPHLTWQFILFGHNEMDIAQARKLASELDMKFVLKLSWDDDYSPVINKDRIRREVGFSSRQEYKDVTGRDYMNIVCHQLWDHPQINWDGRVLGCCRNFWKAFGGNAFRDGLRDSLNGEAIRYARGMLRGERPPRIDVPCSTCDIYLAMKQHRKWIDRESPTILARRLWLRARSFTPTAARRIIQYLAQRASRR